MGKWLIGALLAATAWTPMAQAQDGRGRRGDGQPRTERPADQPRGERGWGNRGVQQPGMQAPGEVRTRGGWRNNDGQTQVSAQADGQAQAAQQRREAQRQLVARERQGAMTRDRNGDGRADTFRRDRNGDGRIDTVARDRNGDGRVDTFRRDINGDGRVDTVRRDRNGDGRFDTVRRDRNGDGRVDNWARGNDFGRANGRYDGRNDGRWNNGNFGNRGNWNRTWRQDNRYDWNGYRSNNRSLFRLPRYYAPYGWNYGYRRFSIGVALSSSLWGQSYWIDDPWSYRLPEAYGQYRWVRYYNDALLVDLRSGIVVDTVYDIFWY